MAFMKNVVTAASNLGVLATAHYAVQRLRPHSVSPRQLRLYSKHARHPVYARAGTSDLDVFRQIFVHREYRCLDGLPEADLVIDCGANVGYSAAYFLSRFPAATVIAVEPDPGNFAQLERNLALYARRVQVLNTAIWSHAVRMLISEAAHGDNREWARTVRETRPGESGGMQAVDIGTLLARSGRQRISVLKIDIEGAEKAVFDAPCPWLRCVDNLVIELHSPECEASFFRAIDGAGFRVTRCDELTVCSVESNAA